jgi:hypothetical protein
MTILSPKNLAQQVACKEIHAPGLVDKILWVALSDVKTFGVVDPNEADIDNLGMIRTPHTFDAGKGFTSYEDMLPNSTRYKADSQGSKGFGNYKTLASGTTRAASPKVIGNMNQTKFQPGIALVYMANGSAIYQIGTKEFPAYAKMDMDTETNQHAEEWGIKIEVEAVQPIILRYDPVLAVTLIS